MQDFLNISNQKGILRRMKILEGAQDCYVKIAGHQYLNFCSNNYLGLASDSRICDSAKKSIDKSGFGSGASRLICGNFIEYEKLEKRMASLKKTESCVIFSTGYMANIGIISALCSRQDIVFSDRLNHSSIVDGIKLSGAQMKRYKHNDMEDLERLLQEHQAIPKKFIITDSVFSMDGDLAPLDEIVNLSKRYQCVNIVDEAHGLGVLGEKGLGLVELLSLEKDIDIQMGTFSKAVGSFGAYCCGKKNIIDYLINKARSFIYTTAMPVSIIEASYQGIQIICDHPELRKKLYDNMAYLNLGLKTMNLIKEEGKTPIIPIIIKDEELAIIFSKRLYEENILITAIRPPTVPKGTSRLRLTVMATHTKKDIDYLLQKMKSIAQELNVMCL